MYIDLADLSPNQVYFAMIQSLIPRPVAWVLSQNENDSYNLAPFSYFNAVCSNPPMIMLSIGKKPDGSIKDSRVNIEARKKFVVHIPHRELAPQVTATSASLPAGESELEKESLKTAPFEGFEVPRLADCRIAFACEYELTHELGPQRQGMILATVKHIFLDDNVAAQDGKRLKINAAAVDPIARLGGNDYTTFGEILTVPRPK